ncbi:HRDC domain-containing protein [Riemerella columbina]|uniref:HRDC domain-containing protein n=1 Tax=Riemerella columbina TaxID=103810 RepID=UPI000377CC22|nr:HRDC domain-containing protein [Riemerella columbina]
MMKIKVFNIRLDKENFERDQESLNTFLEKVEFKKSSTKLIEGKVNYWTILIHYKEIEKNYIEDVEKEDLNEENLSEYEKQIVAYFKQWRFDTARNEGLPTYMVLTNKSIVSLAKNKPRTVEELERIFGIGEHKKEKYGEDIIALLNSI